MRALLGVVVLVLAGCGGGGGVDAGLCSSLVCPGPNGCSESSGSVLCDMRGAAPGTPCPSPSIGTGGAWCWGVGQMRSLMACDAEFVTDGGAVVGVTGDGGVHQTLCSAGCTEAAYGNAAHCN